MNRELLITHASQIVTLAGPARPRVGSEMRELGIIMDGALLARDGVIVAVGATSELASQAAVDAVRIDARNSVVMPGFVDAHTHPVFAGTREDEYEMRAGGMTYQQIAERGGGIRSTVRRTRAASEDELFELGKRRARRLLEHGTTTVEAKSGYGLTVDDELKILRVIKRLNDETPLELIPTFLGAHEIPDEYQDKRENYIRLVIDEMLPRVAAEGLARYCDVFCESHVFTVDESRRVLTRAKELGLGIRLHAEQLSPSGAASLAAELGAASADHLEWIDQAGIVALRRAAVIAILLPGAVFNLGLTRYAPARAMIESELPIALATDFNPGSSPTPSMQMILSIACAQMRMTPAEAATAATINAACSLGCEARLGSLEAGKQADIVVYDRSDYRQIPYFFGVNHAVMVIKKGRVIIDSLKSGLRTTGNSQMSLPPINIVMEEVSDPQEVARARSQFAQAELNSDWLQAHAAEIYARHRGKFIVVAGEELFVADTPEEATALAKAAHPDDEGRIIRYIYPKKMARIYANHW